jgi:hypothetical protein
MKKVKKLLFTAFAACLGILPSLAAYAAGGGAAPIVIVSDTRKQTGILAWWGGLYNESHLQFTILTCILIPVTGCVFGFIADRFIRGLGVDLTKRDLAEH